MASVASERRSRRIRPSRRLFAALVATIAAGAALGYLTLVLSTINAPPAASLGPARSTNTAGSAQSPIAPRRSFLPLSSYTGADGPWVAGADGRSFVGYRAREILGFDFIRSPNEAVARTSAIDGYLEISGQRLVATEITARIASLASDIDMRDGHIYGDLELDRRPDATFVLGAPIDIGQPTRGAVVHVNAAGTLSMLDVSRAVVFPLDASWNGDSIDVAGQLTINRADFGMDVPQLLGFSVAEQVVIEVQLSFTRPCAGACVAAGSPSPTQTGPAPSTRPLPTSVALATLRKGWDSLIFMGLQANIGGTFPLSDIYRLRPGETQPTALTNTPGSLDSGPAVTWDGSTIAFESMGLDSPPAIWVMASDGSAAHAIPGAIARAPSWAPDGRRIVSIQDGEASLVVIDTISGKLQPLAAGAGTDDSPSWSPDGGQIVFSRLATGGNDQDIYAVNADGTGLQRLTSDPAYEYSPRWSRDGRHIAFVRNGDLWVMDPDGSHQRQLTSGIRADVPDWSPDGSRIAFIVGGGVADPDLSNIDPSRQAIWFVGSDGSGLSRIDLPFDLVGSPVWQP